MAVEDVYWFDRERQDLVAKQMCTLLDIADHLLREVIPTIPERYDGSAESIYLALSDPTSAVYQERHERFSVTTINQAMLVYKCHRPSLFNDYINRVKHPTIKGYLAVLRRQPEIADM